MTENVDIIDALAGLPPEAPLRAARPVARANAQKSYESLLTDPAQGLMPKGERLAIALFVAGLHRDEAATTLYADLLENSPVADLQSAIESAIEDGLAPGPYGNFPEGPLAKESRPGLIFKADSALLGERLAAAFEHVHMLVLHPRDADRAAIVALAEAGWSADDIVTLSQLVAFLSFQIRAAAGLRVLAATK